MGIHVSVVQPVCGARRIHLHDPIELAGLRVEPVQAERKPHNIPPQGVAEHERCSLGRDETAGLPGGLVECMEPLPLMSTNHRVLSPADHMGPSPSTAPTGQTHSAPELIEATLYGDTAAALA